MILANGCPKSGTHALMAWLETLGLSRAEGIVKPRGGVAVHMRKGAEGDFVHAHVPYGVDVTEFSSVVTVLRDPRNVLISYARWNDDGIDAIDALDRFLGKSFVERYESFLAWRGKCTIVRYEDIVANNRVSGETDTYTGNPSDWRSYMTRDMEKAWRDRGIFELAKNAGYD